MSLSLKEVDKIAKLARLKFDDGQKQKLQQELTEILNYVDQLKTLTEKDVSGFDLDPDSINLMRNDVAEEVDDTEKFLAQAPSREGRFVKVKSILE